MPESVVDKRSESLFGAFFEHAQTPLLIVSDDLEIIRANAVAIEMLALGTAPHDNLLTGFWSVSAPAVMRLVEGVRRGIAVSPVSARTA